MKPQGYSIQTPQDDPYEGKPVWRAKIRRKGWRNGYWVTVSSDYGPIAYASKEAAKNAARYWIVQNESK